MVKCGSCRAVNADSYKRITNAHNLFNILVNLNPRLVYNEKNSYFCGQCITKATNKLEDGASSISQQNANSLSVANKSFDSTNSNSSKDEYDVMVSRRIVFSETGTPLNPQLIPSRIISERKRAAQTQKENKPCPKRFKKRSTVSQDDIVVPSMPNSSEEVTPQSETDMLLNVERADNDVDSSESSDQLISSETVAGSRASVQKDQRSDADVNTSTSSKTVAVSQRVPVQTGFKKPTSNIVQRRIQLQYDSGSSSEEERQYPWDTAEQLVEVAIENEPIVSNLDVSESDLPLAKMVAPSATMVAPSATMVAPSATMVAPSATMAAPTATMAAPSATMVAPSATIAAPSATMASPSAPAVRNPRIRESNSNLVGDIRRYFGENQQAINVNNYSRTLAG